MYQARLLPESNENVFGLLKTRFEENTPAVTRTRISCLGNGRFILLNYGGICYYSTFNFFNLKIEEVGNSIFEFPFPLNAKTSVTQM